MTGATPKGNQYRTNLRRHHAQLKQTGSYLYRGIRFPHLRDLRFVDSKRSELVQVADLVAYNVYRQFRDHGEAWEQVGLQTLPPAPAFGTWGEGLGVMRIGRAAWSMPAPAVNSMS